MDFSKIRNYLFIGLLLFVTILFLTLLRPFAYPLFWAAVLAALFHPLFKRINSKLKHDSLSTVLTLVIICFIIIVPLLMVAALVVNESVSVISEINNNVSDIRQNVVDIFNIVKEYKLFADFNITETEVVQKVTQYTARSISYLYGSAVRLTSLSIGFVIMFALMLYSLFFFIRDGEKLLKKAMHLSPLGDKFEVALYKKFIATTRASLKGTMLIAILQGGLGGILFAIVGIPAPLIWAIVMVFASLIPSVGSAIIWVPAAIIMFSLGNVWQAVVIVLIGAFVIGLIDNFLRPYLVGKDLGMHPLMILFAVLGGIIMFGASGFIIGPIIAALFLSFWDMYAEYYQAELNNN
jgi:predicted PurR-regulated permease PerM